MLSEEREVFPFSNDWQELGVVGAGPKPLSFLRNHVLPSGPSLARLAPSPRFPLCSTEALLSLSHFLMLLQSFSLVHPDLCSQAPFLFNAAKNLLFLLFLCFFRWQNYQFSGATCPYTNWLWWPLVSPVKYPWGWSTSWSLASARKGTNKFPSHRICNLTSFSEQR